MSDKMKVEIRKLVDSYLNGDTKNRLKPKVTLIGCRVPVDFAHVLDGVCDVLSVRRSVLLRDLLIIALESLVEQLPEDRKRKLHRIGEQTK